MPISQFNVSYIPTEDRMLFRFNTTEGQEFRLWLTRRMTHQLLGLSRSHSLRSLGASVPAPAAPVVDQFQQQALDQQTDFSTSYQPAQDLPLGEEPKLVVEVAITPMADPGQAMSHLTFTLVDTLNLSLNLPNTSINTVRLLLDKLQAQAGWSSAPHAARNGSIKRSH